MTHKPANTLCFYCGRELEREHITKDHVIPRVLGGRNSRDNIVWACMLCNFLKGHYSYEAFLAWLDVLPKAVLDEIRTFEHVSLPVTGAEFQRLAMMAASIKKRHPIHETREPVSA